MSNEPLSILVMGVSGCGKSHVGRLLGERIGAEFVDGDEYHSPASIAKMSRGVPLSDADRADWLATLADLFRQYRERGSSLVIGCSALKRRYRDVLRGGAPSLKVIYLHGERDLLLERLNAREDHFFRGASLLDNQLSTLERPSGDEALQLEISDSPESIVDRAARHLTG
jgi:gluconokinase